MNTATSAGNVLITMILMNTLGLKTKKNDDRKNGQNVQQFVDAEHGNFQKMEQLYTWQIVAAVLNKDKNVQECDATEADSSNTADNQK